MQINKHIKKIFSALIFSLVPFSTALTLSSCNSTTINIGNFQSYMADDLIEKIQSKYTNASFKWYNSNEQIGVKFEGYYDIAICSTYEVKKLYDDGLLAPIPWSYYGDTLGLTYNDGTNDVVVKTGTDALAIFSQKKIIQDVLGQTIDDKNTPQTSDDVHLIDVCVPYFFQDMILAYKTNSYVPISSGDLEWKQAIPIMIEGYKKQTGHKGKLWMIDDSRTIYDVARLIEKDGKSPSVSEELEWLSPEKTDTIDEMEITFSSLSSLFKSNKGMTSLNNDSGTIARNLAMPVEKGGAFACLSYAGDLLYGAMGSDEFDSYTNDNMTFIRPKQNVGVLDCIVINKNVVGSAKQDETYNIVYDISLDGASSKDKSSILETNENDNYIHGAMLNFNTVFYTPVIKNIEEKVLYTGANDSSFESWYNNSYWNGYVSKDDAYFYIQFINYDNNVSYYLEQPLNNKQKDDIDWAYNKFRAEL